MKGTIQRFYFKKGFGFINGDSDVEYFFHYSDYEGEKRDIRPDQVVEFDPMEGEKGPCAVAVREEGAPRSKKPKAKKAASASSSAEAGGPAGPFVAGLLLGAAVGAGAVAYLAGLIRF